MTMLKIRIVRFNNLHKIFKIKFPEVLLQKLSLGGQKCLLKKHDNCMRIYKTTKDDTNTKAIMGRIVFITE